MAFVFTDYKKMTDEDFKRQGLIWTTIDEENEKKAAAPCLPVFDEMIYTFADLYEAHKKYMCYYYKNKTKNVEFIVPNEQWTVIDFQHLTQGIAGGFLIRHPCEEGWIINSNLEYF